MPTLGTHFGQQERHILMRGVNWDIENIQWKMWAVILLIDHMQGRLRCVLLIWKTSPSSSTPPMKREMSVQ